MCCGNGRRPRLWLGVFPDCSNSLPLDSGDDLIEDATVRDRSPLWDKAQYG
jgi:hypothetical protein